MSRLSMMLALLLAAPSFAQPAPPPTCTTFDDQSLAGWTPVNAGSTFQQREDRGWYIRLTDGSGGSNLVAPASLLGDLTQKLGCGQFCFDVNLIANDPAAIKQPASVFLQGANGVTASFMGNQIIAPGSGWHTLCAPLAETSSGTAPPPSSDGAWTVNPAGSWNQLLRNVTALKLKVDWGTSTQSEVVGYDNLCFRPGACPRAEFTFQPACAGAPMSFTSTSTGATSSAWSFGGGNPASSTAANPTTTFAAGGNHAVTLCINGGTAAPLCATKTVTVTPAPAPPVINGPITACNAPATYCASPVDTSVTSYAWSASGGTIAGSTTGSCAQVTWTNPQQGGIVTVTARNAQGCATSTRLPIGPCSGPPPECCRCNELSVKDEKLSGSTFTAQVTASTVPVTRVAVDLLSTSVAPFGHGCGTAGPRESHILSGSLGGMPGVPPVTPASREMQFGFPTPAPLNAASLNLGLQLPPRPAQWWCSDSLSFCLKYAFTGRDCTTCELIECYGPYRRGGIVDFGGLDDVAANATFNLRVSVATDEGGASPPNSKLVVRLRPGSGDPRAKLTGRTTTELIQGKATWSGLTINRAGDGFILEVLVDNGAEPVAASEPFAVRGRVP